MIESVRSDHASEDSTTQCSPNCIMPKHCELLFYLEYGGITVVQVQ